jgi:hypothetical protein
MRRPGPTACNARMKGSWASARTLPAMKEDAEAWPHCLQCQDEGQLGFCQDEGARRRASGPLAQGKFKNTYFSSSRNGSSRCQSNQRLSRNAYRPASLLGTCRASPTQHTDMHGIPFSNFDVDAAGHVSTLFRCMVAELSLPTCCTCTCQQFSDINCHHAGSKPIRSAWHA